MLVIEKEKEHINQDITRTHKQQLKSENMGVATDKGAWGATPQDYGKKGTMLKTNARTFTSENSAWYCRCTCKCFNFH